MNNKQYPEPMPLVGDENQRIQPIPGTEEKSSWK